MLNKDDSIMFIHSSPSGAWKSTISKKIQQKYQNFKISVSHTTRKPRPNEVEGIDYFFLSDNQFQEKIKNNEFNDNEFIQIVQQSIKTTKLNSIRDNKKFDINAVKILYSLPINSFTLINDEKENIYLAKVKDYQVELIDNNNEIIDYTNKQNSNLKNNMLKSYDLYLNSRYNVTLNQKTIERVKNFFKW